MNPAFRPRSSGLAILLVLSLFTSCREQSVATADDPLVARVGGREIRVSDYEDELRWRADNHHPLPNKHELIDELIERAALLERAEREGLHRDPKLVRRWESLLIAQLREPVDNPLQQSNISPEELQAAYEERASEWSVESVDRFSILFIAAEERATPATRDEARARLEEGLAKAAAEPATGGRGPAAGGFGAVAIEFSDDQPSRYRGGDVGWIPSKTTELPRLPASVLDAGRQLALGETSPIIETPSGFFAIMKTDARAGGPRPLEEISGELTRRLLIERQQRTREAFLNEALEAVHIERIERTIDKLPSTQALTSQTPPATSPAALTH